MLSPTCLVVCIDINNIVRSSYDQFIGINNISWFFPISTRRLALTGKRFVQGRPADRETIQVATATSSMTVTVRLVALDSFCLSEFRAGCCIFCPFGELFNVDFRFCDNQFGSHSNSKLDHSFTPILLCKVAVFLESLSLGTYLMSFINSRSIK